AQEVLLKLWAELPRFTYDPARGRFRSWLKAVVRNALADYRRRQRRRSEGVGVGGTAFLERLGNLASPAAVDELSGAIEPLRPAPGARGLARVRAKLKESPWQAFYQHTIEQRPAAAVAQDLGLAVASVYKATFRVKKMLREEYRHAYHNGGESASLPGRED